ncbi:hypothetical protein Sfr7A_15140 [Streptomyces xinghaiensis]|nr:hypothetical protein Sfr7A_15140 [Streptomyces xinghaiensis]
MEFGAAPVRGPRITGRGHDQHGGVAAHPGGLLRGGGGPTVYTRMFPGRFDRMVLDGARALFIGRWPRPPRGTGPRRLAACCAGACRRAAGRDPPSGSPSPASALTGKVRRVGCLTGC